MDQDSFRRLLETPRPIGSATTTLGVAQRSRSSLLANASKPKTKDSSETAFKPRKLKKQGDSKYRDRAAERRVGEGNDYAHVEAIYEEFAKKTAGSQNKEEVEAQRRYLGGDSEHSILVKGLDHSLLEQNKARAGLSTSIEDDDALEEAFMEATSHTPIVVPKKRTREELIRDLKEQRARNAEQATQTADEEARTLEEAKQKGKFKPIGFKPIGPTSESKKKKNENRNADDVERKNKKRKIDTEGYKAVNKDNSLMPPPPLPTKAEYKPKTPEPEEPIDDDFNIFADAGEYEGIDVGDDDDDENAPQVNREAEERDESSSSMAYQRWIPSDETEPSDTKPLIPPLSDVAKQSPSHKVVSDGEVEDEQPMRLVPLSSSALPSIKDFLALDQAAGSYDKKKKKKNKKKAGTDDDDDDDDDKGQKQKSVEAKVDRDYKRLKSYTDKKTAIGNK